MEEQRTKINYGDMHRLFEKENKFAAIAAICFIFLAVFIFILMVSITPLAYRSMIFCEIVFCAGFALLAVGLFKKSINILLVGAAVLVAADFIEFAGNEFADPILSLIELGAYSLLLVVIILAVKNNEVGIKLWFLPGIVWFAYMFIAFLYSMSGSYSNELSLWFPQSVITAIALFFTGVWLKKNPDYNKKLEDNAFGLSNNESITAKGIPIRATVPMILMFIGLGLLMLTCLTYFNNDYYGILFFIFNTLFTLPGIALIIIAVCQLIFIEGSEIVVTDRRILGKGFGDLKYVDIPLNEITAISDCSLNGLSIFSIGGNVTLFYGIANRDEIKGLIEERSGKNIKVNFGELWMARIVETCLILFIIGIIVIVVGVIIGIMMENWLSFIFLLATVVPGVIMLFAKYLSIPARAHAQMVMDTRVIRDKVNKIESDEYNDDDEF